MNEIVETNTITENSDHPFVDAPATDFTVPQVLDRTEDEDEVVATAFIAENETNEPLN